MREINAVISSSFIERSVQPPRNRELSAKSSRSVAPDRFSLGYPDIPLDFSFGSSIGVRMTRSR